MSNEKNKVESSMLLHTDRDKDMLIKQAITNIFLMLKEQKKTHRLPEDIEKNNLGLYKKIRRLPSLRDTSNKIKRSLIEALGKKTYPESILLTEEVKLKQDFQKFIKSLIDDKYTTWTPSDLTEKRQGLYKRIKKQDTYKHPEKGYLEWDRVHSDLGGEYSTQIKVEFEPHIEYTKIYIQKLFNNFFDTLEKKRESTRSPQDLNHYDRGLYSHIIKNSNENKDYSFWEAINQKYGRPGITLTYQPYTDVYIKQRLDLLYTKLKKQLRKNAHPQDIHIFDPLLFVSFGQKKFRGDDGRIDWGKVSEKYRIYEDMPLKRKDKLYTQESQKALFNNFFTEIGRKGKKYRSPALVKKSNPSFYKRLREIYRFEDKIDRLYILIHIVQNQDNIRWFSHKFRNDFKTKLKYSYITSDIEKHLYRLVEDIKDPEEELIHKEESQKLQRAILQLTKEEQATIKNFYDEQEIEKNQLETIIQKLINIIKPEL